MRFYPFRSVCPSGRLRASKRVEAFRRVSQFPRSLSRIFEVSPRASTCFITLQRARDHFSAISIFFRELRRVFASFLMIFRIPLDSASFIVFHRSSKTFHAYPESPILLRAFPAVSALFLTLAHSSTRPHALRQVPRHLLKFSRVSSRFVSLACALPRYLKFPLVSTRFRYFSQVVVSSCAFLQGAMRLDQFPSDSGCFDAIPAVPTSFFKLLRVSWLSRAVRRVSLGCSFFPQSSARSLVVPLASMFFHESPHS